MTLKMKTAKRFLGAREAHRLLGAAMLLPIHWATFELGLHAWSEPAETLVTEAAGQGAKAVTPRLGEPIEPAAVDAPDAWWRELPPIAATCPSGRAPLTLRRLLADVPL